MKNAIAFLSLMVVSTLSFSQSNNTYPWPATGNIGIGTNAPGLKALFVNADVSGDHSTLIRNINPNGLGVILSAAYDPLRVGPLADTEGSYFKVTSNGFIGVGTTNPAARLHISEGGFRHGGVGEINIDAVGAVGGRLKILDNGNVGIGTASPAARLHINEGGFRHGGTGEITIDAIGVDGGRLKILNNGNVGIGTPNPGSFKLAVEGKIGAREVQVTTAAWADYVFKPDYKLRPLGEVESFIRENQHLPEVPSEKEVLKEGHLLGVMDVVLLKKIEELTLYIIEQNKSINQQKEINKDLSNSIEELRKQIDKVNSQN